MELPPLLDPKDFKKLASFQEYSDILIDLQFDVNLLLDEGLLFYFGLSPIETELSGSLGKMPILYFRNTRP